MDQENGYETHHDHFLSVEMKIKQALKFKEQGNQFFKEKNLTKALSNYHKVLTFLNGIQGQSDEYFKYAKDGMQATQNQENIINDLKMTTYLNMTQVYINQGKYEKGLKTVQNSLKLKETQKGLYRAAICNFYLDNLFESRQQFNYALLMDPSLDKDIDDWQKKIEQREKKLDKGLAKQMKKMWA